MLPLFFVIIFVIGICASIALIIFIAIVLGDAALYAIGYTILQCIVAEYKKIKERPFYAFWYLLIATPAKTFFNRLIGNEGGVTSIRIGYASWEPYFKYKIGDKTYFGYGNE